MGAHPARSTGYAGVALAEIVILALYNAYTDCLLNALRALGVATAYEDEMAKKTTTTRPKNESEADAAAAPAPVKRSARTRAPKTTADKKVAAGSRKSTSVSMASEP